jgi:recombination protein RecR
VLQKLPTLQKLINQLRHIPYLASKNVYRVALHFLNSNEQQIEQLCMALMAAKKAIKPCAVCFNWTEDCDICAICSQEKRKKQIICVVETWHDLIAIERAGGYLGVYHVLGGALCPLQGIGPENLQIDSLLKRVHEQEVSEIIFATNPTPEGEATASFISAKLDRQHLGVSKLASGVPTGSSLEYMDRVTIYKALSGRRPF